MRILVTGGAGFIGQKLCRALKSIGHEVLIIDNFNPKVHRMPKLKKKEVSSEFETFDFDIAENWESKFDENVDWIFHLASETGTGESMYNLVDYSSTNLQGTSRVGEFWLKNDASGMTLASSRSVYGNGSGSCKEHGKFFLDNLELNDPFFSKPPRCPICKNELRFLPSHEGDQLFPNSVYATTKLTQEWLLRNIQLDKKLNIYRFQNVYGKGQALHNPYTGILAIFLNRLANKLPVELFENGLPVRDFIHVDDVISIMVETFQQNIGVLNVGSGIATSIRSIATSYCELLGLKEADYLSITSRYRSGDVFYCQSDNAKLLSVVGDYEFTDFSSGLRDFFNHSISEIESGIGINYDESIIKLQQSGLLRSE